MRSNELVKWRLLCAVLAFVLSISVALLLFGTNFDKLLPLVANVLGGVVTALFIFIINHMLFRSPAQPPSRTDELEKLVRVVKAQLETQCKNQVVIADKSTNLEKQLERVRKDISSIRNKLDKMDANSDKATVLHK